MIPERVVAAFFSATGNTKKVSEMLAERLALGLGLPMVSLDFTLPAARTEDMQYAFSESDLVVFGMPTYAGKLPNKLLPFVKSGFSGNGALAVLLVTFGNRSFDHSLAELAACMKMNGFRIIAAGAFAMTHAFRYDEKSPAFLGAYDLWKKKNKAAEKAAARTLGRDRPDADDLAELERYADGILTWLHRHGNCPAEAAADGYIAADTEKGSKIRIPGDAVQILIPGDPDAPYYTPRGLDGDPVNFLKARPKTDADRCTGCGICAAACPMGSIRMTAETADAPAHRKTGVTVSGICIKCHACVKACPAGAVYFDDPAYFSHRAMLERDYSARKMPEWYLAD